MIPTRFVKNWQEFYKWQDLYQVEQDLVITRALIELYKDPYISDSLVFRGGTALNKLYINPPSRYSEDCDFVQKRKEPIGKTIDTIREIFSSWLGEPIRKITQRGVKLIYRYENIDGERSKLKIEINTTEHFQVLPIVKKEFISNSKWFEGQVNIMTYHIDELMATKLRALYQRRKGRDLFDMWYVLKNDLIDIDRVIDVFHKYCEYNNENIFGKDFIVNLNDKIKVNDFRRDMEILLPLKQNWDFEEAYQYVIDNIVSKIK